MIVKICGITDVEETEYLNENNVDMAGMVLYFPKSKRNITLEKAKEIMASLNENIKFQLVCPDKTPKNRRCLFFVIAAVNFAYHRIP